MPVGMGVHTIAFDFECCKIQVFLCVRDEIREGQEQEGENRK